MGAFITMADTMEELNTIDRSALMENLASELPWICGEMGDSVSGMAIRTGLGKERLSLIASKKRKMKWSEYLSILFVLWDDEKGREIVEERGYFPDALKAAMTINRNDHGKVNSEI